MEELKHDLDLCACASHTHRPGKSWKSIMYLPLTSGSRATCRILFGWLMILCATLGFKAHVLHAASTADMLLGLNSGSPDPVAAGAHITYTIVATNIGPSQ